MTKVHHTTTHSKQLQQPANMKTIKLVSVDAKHIRSIKFHTHSTFINITHAAKPVLAMYIDKNKIAATDYTFSNRTKRHNHKLLSAQFNKKVNTYEPKELFKLLHDKLPRLRNILQSILQLEAVTTLQAASTMIGVFQDELSRIEVANKMQHATTNVDNVHRTRPFGAIELHGKGISVRLKTLETALKSLALVCDIPDDSHVLSFIANAAAIFRKLNYKDPNGKKTACAFKKGSAVNTSTLKFPTIRELEQMLEERQATNAISIFKAPSSTRTQCSINISR